jgi:WD40 repeat protein
VCVMGADYPSVRGLCFSSDGHVVVVGASRSRIGFGPGSVDLWGRATGQKLARLNFPDPVTSVAVSSDSARLAVACGDSIYIYRISDVIAAGVDTAVAR